MASALRPVLVLLAGLLAPAATAQTLLLHVDHHATGAGTGLSWADAFTDLQPALSLARAHQAEHGAYTVIWVAEGSYAPAGPDGPRTATFTVGWQCGLYGGFAGDETWFDQRDPVAHPTILTGDLQGDDQPPWINHQNNAYHVVTADGMTTDSIVDGFTIRGGYADEPDAAAACGGGVRALGGAPRLVRCIFEGNLANDGGAVFIGGYWWPGYSGSLVDCVLQGNVARSGGAMHVAADAWEEIDGSTFIDNLATGTSALGGALLVEHGAHVDLRRSRFLGNVAEALDPAQALGGAICNLSGALALQRCSFAGNAAGRGGGMWTGAGLQLVDGLFTGNTAQRGGGLFNGQGDSTLIGCSFAGNTASEGGGVLDEAGAHATLLDCVLWGNTAAGQPPLHAQLRDLGEASTLAFSLVQGLFDAIPGEDPPDPSAFPGCLADDPLLVDALGPDGQAGTEDDDLSLGPGSPARDAGSNAARPAGVYEDSSDAARFVDDPLAPDVGLGSPPLADMGALEADAPRPWTTLHGGTPNGQGCARLVGSGSLLPGSPGLLAISHYMPGSYALLFVSLDDGAQVCKGGIIRAWPPILILPMELDFYAATLPWDSFPATASGLSFEFQLGLGEPSALYNTSFSNAVRVEVP